MNAAKKGLGRGLSALFGDIDKKSESKQSHINKIPIADLQRNKYQPRTLFDEEKLNELSLSIKENGIIQLITMLRKEEDLDTNFFQKMAISLML